MNFRAAEEVVLPHHSTEAERLTLSQMHARREKEWYISFVLFLQTCILVRSPYHSCEGLSQYLARLAVEQKCGIRRLCEVRGGVRDGLRWGSGPCLAPDEVRSLVVRQDVAEVLACAGDREDISRRWNVR